MGWKGETARGSSRKLSLGLDLRFDLGLGFRLGFPLDIGEWQVSRGSKHPRRA